MKKIVLISLVLVLALVSCDQENIGTLYEPENAYVAFSSPVVSDNVLSASNNYSVHVQIVRSDLTAPTTATVSLEMNDNTNGKFALESNSVTFESGKGEAYINIVPVVDPSLLDPLKTYVFNLTITSDNASALFNTTTYKASFEYTPIGSGTFTSEFFEGEWTVNIEKLEVGSLILYKAKALYESGNDIIIIVDGENATIAEQKAWYSEDYGDVYVTGTGTLSGKVLTMTLEHLVPNFGTWGDFTEVLTLP